MPDQHLGRNTAFGRLGVPLDQMAVWRILHRALRRAHPRPSSSAARLIRWKGHCSVHVRFTAEADRPGPRAAYPACASSSIRKSRSTCAVQAADDSGSDRITSSRQVRQGAPGLGPGGRHRGPPRPPARRRRRRSTGSHRALARPGGLPGARPCSASRPIPPPLGPRAPARRPGATTSVDRARTSQNHWGRGSRSDRTLQGRIHCSRRRTGVESATAPGLRSSTHPPPEEAPSPWPMHCRRLPYDKAALEPAHRRPDDGDPPRQAPPGLRHQPEQRHRQAPELDSQEPRRTGARLATACPTTSAAGPQQRRRPLQSLAVLEDDGARMRAARRRGELGGRHQRGVRQLRRVQGEVRRPPAWPVR